MPRRFTIILVALALDVTLGEPPAAVHPVVWIGKAIERVAAGAPRGHARQLLHGAIHAALLAGLAAMAGAVVARLAAAFPAPLATLTEAAILKTAFSLRGLTDAAHRVEADLDAGNVEAARIDARALVSRDTRALDRTLLASAAVESVAENAADSVVAPLLYYVGGGLPAALAYRAVNTLDAMIGYRGEHEFNGKAPARLDDLLNFVPARLTAALLLAGAALAGGNLSTAWRVLRRDAGLTASPNAGWPMSAMAGALGVRLEKPGHYRLGDPLPPADTPAIDHAVQIVRAAVVAAIPLLLIATRWRAGGRP
jgi:adenosylcobinamide-phosphate synthase